MTPKESVLLQELLSQKDERTELQKLKDRYDLYVQDEQEEREKLIEILKDVDKCKDFDELKNFKDRVEKLREDVQFNLDMQSEIIDEIFNEIENDLSK